MMTFKQGVDEFIRELRLRGYAGRTLEAYQFDLEKFSRHLDIIYDMDVASIDLDAVESEHIRSWLDTKLTDGNSPRTVSRKLASIKSMFRHLHDQELIRENPAEKLKLPRLRKKPPVALSQDEIRQLVNAPDPAGKNYLMERALLVTMYSTGLRVSEAANLKVLHLSMERRAMRVPGKGSKERIIPLTDTSIAAILEYLNDREKRHPESMEPSKTLFMKEARSGLKGMNVRWIQYLVEVCGKRAGLMVHAHPHLLRHSIATHLIEEGANVESVRQTLGHEDLATTSLYVKASSKFLLDEHKKFNPTDNLIKITKK